jgi:hypothetical protein
VVDSQEFTPFSLLEMLTKESRTYSRSPAALECRTYAEFSIRVLSDFDAFDCRLQSLGVSHSTATRLITGISMQSSAAASSPRMDLTVVPVEWLNNLTSDSRYSNLPKKLSALLEPSFNGYPSPPAHNVVNLILVANAASAEAVYYAALMPMMVKRNVPVRFGAIFYTDNVLQVQLPLKTFCLLFLSSKSIAV